MTSDHSLSGRQMAAFAFFYLSYYGFLGVFSPYWGPYLKSLWVPMAAVGLLTALPQINRIYAPALWGWLADWSGRGQLVLRLAGLGSVLSISLLLFTHTLTGMFVAIFVASFFWSATLPQVEASLLAYCHGDSGQYSRLRIFGSLGFMLATLAGGYLIAWAGVRVLPMLVVIIMLCMALFCWSVPPCPARLREPGKKTPGVMLILRRREVQAILLACLLVGTSHGLLQSFYSIHVEEQGISKEAMGWLWSAGIMAEIVVFWQMRRLSGRFALKHLYLLGMVVGVVRYSVIAWCAGSFWVLLVAQLGHAFTFGSHHAVTMAYLHRHFGDEHQAKGQALYIVVCFGTGGSIGGIAAGALWETLGGGWLFSLAALLSLLAAMVCLTGIRLDEKAQN